MPIVVAQRDSREIQRIPRVDLHTDPDGPLSVLDDIFYIDVNEQHQRCQRDQCPDNSEKWISHSPWKRVNQVTIREANSFVTLNCACTGT